MDVYELNEEHVNVYYIKRHENLVRNSMFISWDISNNLIHNLMVYESNLLECYNNHIHSCFWVNIIKELMNWITGIIIYINVRSWGDGIMKIEFSSEIFKNYSSTIDENGYFLVKKYGEFYKFHCIYNEILDDNNIPYILK
jgi:hypothetical protein